MMALNAPLFLILLYGIALVGLLAGGLTWYFEAATAPNRAQVWTMVLALILLGAGLALLGTAYLHDVWYC